ncbi:MAG: type II toxin-antitoxin system HicB family antitoxin [Symbiobacteriaceae bacterium]|nr:type II toxin-antitoxin system HicB family antitoxin [Symbiobacteriaceae bacterium]
MKYVYPAILRQGDNSVGVSIPDLPGCHTYGNDLADALIMAKDAVEMWLWSAEDEGIPIPPASDNLSPGLGETCTLVVADTTEYRKANDARAVKKTLSIPSWLNQMAEKANAPFSQILQQGLKSYLNIE